MKLTVTRNGPFAFVSSTTGRWRPLLSDTEMVSAVYSQGSQPLV